MVTNDGVPFANVGRNSRLVKRMGHYFDLIQSGTQIPQLQLWSNWGSSIFFFS